jgi:hypothetical protein
MPKCRKWRRQRMEKLDRLETSRIRISARKDERDLIMLFDRAATESVLHSIEHTAVDKRREVGNSYTKAQRVGGWSSRSGRLRYVMVDKDEGKARLEWWGKVRYTILEDRLVRGR